MGANETETEINRRLSQIREALKANNEITPEIEAEIEAIKKLQLQHVKDNPQLAAKFQESNANNVRTFNMIGMQASFYTDQKSRKNDSSG